MERGDRDVEPALIKLVLAPEVDAIGLNTAAIHALWTLHGLGSFNGASSRALTALVEGLAHDSASVRKNAAQVAPRTATGRDAILALSVTVDPDAHVRLQAMLALADMPPSTLAARAIAAALNDPENMYDRWIPDAIASAGARHDKHFLEAVVTTDGLDARSQQVVRVVAEHYARGNPQDIVESIVLALSDAGEAALEAVVGGLADGWPRRVPLDTKGPLIRLASAWGNAEFKKRARTLGHAFARAATDDAVSDPVRIERARQAVELLRDDTPVAEMIIGAGSPQTWPSR